MKTFVNLLLFGFLLTSCANQAVLSDLDLDGVHDTKDACPNEAGSPFNMGCADKTVLSSVFDKKLSTDSDLDGVSDDKDECPNQYGSPFNMGCPL